MSQLRGNNHKKHKTVRGTKNQKRPSASYYYNVLGKPVGYKTSYRPRKGGKMIQYSLQLRKKGSPYWKALTSLPKKTKRKNYKRGGAKLTQAELDAIKENFLQAEEIINEDFNLSVFNIDNWVKASGGKNVYTNMSSEDAFKLAEYISSKYPSVRKRVILSDYWNNVAEELENKENQSRRSSSRGLKGLRKKYSGEGGGQNKNLTSNQKGRKNKKL